MNKELIDGMISMIGCDAPKEVDGDYRGSDGLLYCGKCNTRKEKRLKLPDPIGGERIVPVMCECASAEAQAEDEARQQRENMRLLDQLRKASLMDAMYHDSTFATSRVTGDNRVAIGYAQRYCEKFPEMLERNRGLLFYGPPGTGKTHIAACIANELMCCGYSALMTSFVKLNAIAYSDDEEDIIAKMRKVKLLIIDDLGAERGTDASLERVYNIIDSRVRAKLPLIMTTNLSMKQMRDASDTRYWRIYDRVFQVCFPIELHGASFRQREAKAMYDEMTGLLG